MRTPFEQKTGSPWAPRFSLSFRVLREYFEKERFRVPWRESVSFTCHFKNKPAHELTAGTLIQPQGNSPGQGSGKYRHAPPYAPPGCNRNALRATALLRASSRAA